eukprot:CAMPEP_0172169868 /NCGR_PEP_ID=MMETSP1050-20130122/10949_1 /TAXON_ID=233186 /ORGANISM="Cryptomonas curvata, Strain CCAP979/52" /LENGTH=231 /DNA_ID=CAMNT_0012840983 /DNA_START=109 /DNA_END=801 /DNA_ORIENTATION=+
MRKIAVLPLFFFAVLQVVVCTATGLSEDHRPDAPEIPISVDEINIASLIGDLEPLKVENSLRSEAGPGESLKILGVDPTQLNKYLAGNQFQCNVSETETIFIDRKKINDDYCDCIDGSDEPGTAACSGIATVAASTFYCVNYGSEPARVAASRVNDGVCDCCDGSDEHATAACPANRCKELALQEIAAAKAALEGLERGVQTRYRYEMQARDAAARLELDIVMRQAEAAAQ